MERTDCFHVTDLPNPIIHRMTNPHSILVADTPRPLLGEIVEVPEHISTPAAHCMMWRKDFKTRVGRVVDVGVNLVSVQFFGHPTPWDFCANDYLQFTLASNNHDYLMIKSERPPPIENRLLFEGVGGGGGASTANLDYHRLRTRMRSPEGKVIYLELSVGERRSIWVWHCFERDCSEISRFRNLEGRTSGVWDLPSILRWVNLFLGCKFSEITIEDVNVHGTMEPICVSPI